ncbi:uncharacterized protein LOC135703731 isoform X2 [Ochlerotatus camptorhynchus]|uniref:uncharacterized protein LOC135703731 isoform X2 n=1 Tax=Ochlerotatus camptorhynchus TaxID=644619 RepID=UPI0031D6E071
MQSPSTTTCMLDDFRCRLCFTSSDINLQPLFPPGEGCFVNDLLSRIYDCLAIHVSFLEDFCSVICSVCRDKINSIYNFKKQCQSNDGYLREKRSRQMNGVELERMSQMNRDQPDDANESQCKVEELQEEDMLRQAKSIFNPNQATEPESMVNIPSKVDVVAQISGTSSNESFRGFPNEFIENSVTVGYETISEPPVSVDDIQECHVPLKKLDIKPSVDFQRSTITEKGNCPTPRGKYRKQIKDEPISPRLLRKKAVLYFDGYEYRKPRTCHGGSIQWECCKISCSATLQQKPDGKLKLNAKHQQHQQQVVNDGMILDRKMRKRVPFLMTNNNHKKKFIYNDSFRFNFSQKLSNGQMIWTCDDQPKGCKAYVRITGDFRLVTPIFQHNHTTEVVVRRRIVN